VTVFFRLLLAIPLYLWLIVWGFGVFFLVIFNWFVLLFRAQTPDGLHRFLTMYVNYATHVHAYLTVAANRYPGFLGEPGYEFDVLFDPPQRQNRWTVAFRLVLAFPAFLLAAVLTGSGGPTYGGGGGNDDYGSSYGAEFFGVLFVAAIVAWFYALFRGRAPEGTTRLNWYCLHYGAQAWSYILLITDRYPNSDPLITGVPRTPPPHPITWHEEEDSLERSRITVFFRFALWIPHLFWLMLWSIAMFVVAILNWFATLFRGRSPDAFHNFAAAYVRYQIHMTAFLTLVANPFPGFTGARGSYPVDVEIAPPERQNRWWTAFRLILAVPAFLISSGLGAALYVAAFLGWFASLFTGRMPRGIRNLGAMSLRYSAQLYAFTLLLTDRYPYAGPPAGAVPESAPEPPVDTAAGNRLADPPEPPPSWPDPPPRPEPAS
jgi:hypothetical protein